LREIDFARHAPNAKAQASSVVRGGLPEASGRMPSGSIAALRAGAIAEVNALRSTGVGWGRTALPTGVQQID